MSQSINFDVAVRAAVQQLKQKQIDNIPPLNQLAALYTPSQSLTDRLESIISKAEKIYSSKRWTPNIAKIAAAIIITVTLLSATPTVATAMKKIFSQTVVQWFDKYISVETKADIYPQTVKDFTVGYITEGFELVEEYKIGTTIQKVYYNDKLYLSIQIDNDDNSNIISLDNEYTLTEEIVIGEDKALLLSRTDGYTALIISSDGIQYFLDGYVQSDEIIKVYKNINIML